MTKKLVRSFWEVKTDWRKTASEWNTNCPFCLDVRGKPDRDKKLYWNPGKRIGSCKKCETVIVDPSTPSLEFIYETRFKKEKETPKPQIFTLSWTKSALEVDWARDYLHGRGFDDSVIDFWNMRAGEFPTPMVVLPNRFDSDSLTTDFFQARYLRPGKLKYATPSNAIKPVYGIDRLKENAIGIFVGEGCFSAISANSLEGWSSVATYGKSATFQQLKAIAETPAKYVCVVYDGGEITALSDTAESFLSSDKEVFIAVLPFQEDPNSVKDFNSVIKSRVIPFSESTPSLLNKLRNMDRASWEKVERLARPIDIFN